ncbi:hypothetical protein LX15_006354 [Streptoalloteichus tenebrarius]|uniref:Uncharacterized protein n=1 Tax=Streptoalloteichus tenebrarius (strain ATCC 17920 / DSM 40477 / JCM 4838 / CBS 697.72 / NBRC 16177 / NCIMB 11028 / NRRL B-12390 / A12253. 1 / ISP 5477) TaxID=1933 RepID=A0ABT1I4C0_STRSD|nr:hypothetical protein [Streptoalloteichus tenebrarius]MCP2262607.1 hypothetical protein [Streptoalloteichus tenebrarius]MCP2262613.1 hypothetical protein [Streptoalloteichus tenebrarius]BFF01937.1 hypothetical protein GCM10020241_36120 [Streptoalloteichus tenebrarius]
MQPQPTLPTLLLTTAVLDVRQFEAETRGEGSRAIRSRVHLDDLHNWTVERGERVITCRDGEISPPRSGAYEVKGPYREQQPVWASYAGFWTLQLLCPALFTCCLDDDCAWKIDGSSATLAGTPAYYSPQRPVDGIVADPVVRVDARLDLRLGVATHVTTTNHDGTQFFFLLRSVTPRSGVTHRWEHDEDAAD